MKSIQFAIQALLALVLLPALLSKVGTAFGRTGAMCVAQVVHTIER